VITREHRLDQQSAFDLGRQYASGAKRLCRIQNAERCLLTDTTTFIQHPVDRCHTDTGISGYILKRCFA
jgi:hypothetical protein